MCILEEFKHIYCLFCRSGAEQRMREAIEQKFRHIHVLFAVQEKHRIINGHQEIDRRIFLPGYLFLYTDEELDFDSFHRIHDIYKILGDEANGCELQRSDRAFARWLWMNKGIIGISLLQNHDGKIEILSGPMKYFAEDIIRINKHTKNALVKMRFMDKESEIWLAFEFKD